MTTPPTQQSESHRPTAANGGPGRVPPHNHPPGRRRRRPAPRKSSIIGTIAWSLAALIIVIAGAVTAAVFVLSPADIVRSELIRQVAAKTGRTLTIAGRPSLTIYPSIGVSLPRVSLSPPPGMAGGPMMQSDQVHVSVALLPLFNRNVIVERISLDRPIIELRVDGSGRRNWDFASAKATGTAAAATGATAQSDKSLETLDALELRAIQISDGLVQYLDERSGAGEILSDVDVSVRGRRIADPISLTGDLTWRGERLKLALDLSTLRQLLQGQKADAKLTVKAKPATVDFNGRVMLEPAAAIDGTINLKAGSAQRLVKWIGTELPNGSALGGLSASGRLNATAAAIAFNGAKLKLGETAANGSVAVRLKRARPLVTANLGVSQLDIDKLSTHLTGAKQLKRPKMKPVSHRADQGGATNPQPPKSIEEILRGAHNADDRGAGRFSPQVRGFKQSAGWSKEPIDASGLRSLDTDARLKIAGLKVGGLAIGNTSLRVRLDNGNARADFDNVALYQGKGRGIVTVAPTDTGLRVGLNVTMDDVSARPLLKDAADIDTIAGTGRLTGALTSAGRSQQEIMSNLAGKASFMFKDGAIVGWNIPQILRGLQAGQVASLQKAEASKTDFSELTANFAINRGIANTQDLRMLSPLLRLTGSGNTDVGGRRLDMILRPKLVASLSGQGGQTGLTGIEVPVRVSGPWRNPNFQPDVAGILNNRQAVDGIVKNAKQLRDKFKGKNANQILRGLLKNGNQDGTDAGAHSAGKLLENLFRQ